MKNTKVSGWLLSFVLILGVVLPCMFAVAKDVEETESVFCNDTVEAVEENQEVPVEDTEEDQEIPVEEAEENQETGASIESLEPNPLPPVVIEKYDDEPVVSEIIYPTVSFTRVAPFGAPVTGGAN